MKQLTDYQATGIKPTNKHVIHKQITKQNHAGFTLIELVTVIIIIGILSVNVVPKFLSSSGFEEYTYRDELLTKLRGIQQRAMQETNVVSCLVSVTATQVFGCDSNFAGDTTSVAVSTSHNVSFAVSNVANNTFSFSTLGRPQGCVASPCEITLTVVGNEQSLAILINEEGYIYAP